MFTSRAEHRLMLRHDTADTRLTAKGREIGLVSDGRWERFQKKREGLEAIQELVKNRKEEELSSWPEEWVNRVLLDIKYSGYIEKEKRVAAKLEKMDSIKISPNMDYSVITGFSAEAKEKLISVRPLTVGQAARIPGIRQGDIALLMILAKRK